MVKRLANPANHELPISIPTFLTHGKPGEDYVAIIAYDELLFIIKELGKAMTPFLVTDIPASKQPEEIMMLPVKVKDLQHVAAILKNVGAL